MGRPPCCKATLPQAWAAGSLPGGTWNTTKAGSLTETGTATNCKALAGDATWTDYTYSVRGRKTAGKEGFLVLFHVVGVRTI